MLVAHFPLLAVVVLRNRLVDNTTGCKLPALEPAYSSATYWVPVSPTPVAGFSATTEPSGENTAEAVWDQPAFATFAPIVPNDLNQCGAIAETKQNEVSPGLGKTRKEAEDRSLAACRTAGGKTCTVAASVCSVK